MSDTMIKIMRILDRNNVTVSNTISEEEEKIKEVEKIASEIDSLTYISILMDIEKEFQIELSDDALSSNVFTDMKNFERDINACLVMNK